MHPFVSSSLSSCVKKDGHRFFYWGGSFKEQVFILFFSGSNCGSGSGSHSMPTRGFGNHKLNHNHKFALNVQVKRTMPLESEWVAEE